MNAIVETTRLDPHAIQDLMHRVDASFPRGRGRVVGFIASGRGEGTTTVASAYARGVAQQLRRRVLLLDAASPSAAPPAGGIGSLAGVLTTLAVQEAGRNPTARLPQAAAAPVPGMAEGATLWELLPRTELWYALRAAYDEVVLDLPAASDSRLGVAVAPYCDGVAVVIEAERTRAPVVDSLVSHLTVVRARVLGAVLNRRRYHLPQPIYRLL